ncbi:MFS transporter [Streptomyces sp. NBC_01506]|uniref:MFS transporter n=1 Tax=Streptomyces sp. NBC_01506 TaxID=2903887 RepID=UPI0038706DF7
MRTAKRTAFASFLGTTFQFLDASIYGIVAAVVFSKVFFPADNPQLASVGAVATFAVAYVTGPIGAFVLGPLGDRIGRQKMTVITITGMGVATFLIGCLPGYGTIGFAAPVLLVILRIFQGFFTSSEQAGTSSLTMEHAPTERRGFFVSFINVGVGVGAVLGQLAFIPILALPEDDLLSWGWRIPFLASIVWTAIVLIFRRSIHDADVFVETKNEGKVARYPVAPLFRDHWRSVIRVILLCLMAVPGTVVGVYAFGYGVDTVGIPASELLTVQLIVIVVTTPLLPLWGLLGDRIGRKPVFAGGVLIGGLLIFPLFLALKSGNLLLVALLEILAYGFLNAGQALQLSMFTEMFPTKVRTTGVAIGSQLGFLVAGFAPTICYAIQRSGPSGWVPAAVFTTGVCVIASIAAFTGRETANRDVTVLDSAEAPTP